MSDTAGTVSAPQVTTPALNSCASKPCRPSASASSANNKKSDSGKIESEQNGSWIWRCAPAHFVASVLALVGFVLLSSTPGNAISYTTEPFEVAASEETARWIELFGAKDGTEIRVRSATVRLHEVVLSMTRIENQSCIDDVCPTHFKYRLDRDFEFVVRCKGQFLILDTLVRDRTGKLTVSIEVTTDNSTVLITPTSLGPVIAVTKSDR